VLPHPSPLPQSAGTGVGEPVMVMSSCHSSGDVAGVTDSFSVIAVVKTYLRCSNQSLHERMNSCSRWKATAATSLSEEGNETPSELAYVEYV